MDKTIEDFMNDNFTIEEENFIQKIIKTFKGFETSNYFHSQLLKFINLNKSDDIKDLIKLVIQDTFFKQNTDYEKNLSSEPYLRFMLPITDLKYHDNNLRIKIFSFNQFIDSDLIELIEEKFDTNYKKNSIDLSTIEKQIEYLSFVEKRITLTLFFVYEIENNSFSYRYFFQSKGEILQLLFQELLTQTNNPKN